MGAHLIDGQFRSDKHPTCPAGKVPLSVEDPSAQPLLWEYAQRWRPVDAEFSDHLEQALLIAGYVPKVVPREEERTGMCCPDCDRKQKRLDVQTQPDGSLAVRISCLIPAQKIASEIKALCAFLRGFIA